MELLIVHPLTHKGCDRGGAVPPGCALRVLQQRDPHGTGHGAVGQQELRAGRLLVGLGEDRLESLAVHRSAVVDPRCSGDGLLDHHPLGGVGHPGEVPAFGDTCLERLVVREDFLRKAEALMLGDVGEGVVEDVLVVVPDALVDRGGDCLLGGVRAELAAHLVHDPSDVLLSGEAGVLDLLADNLLVAKPVGDTADHSADPETRQGGDGILAGSHIVPGGVQSCGDGDVTDGALCGGRANRGDRAACEGQCAARRSERIESARASARGSDGKSMRVSDGWKGIYKKRDRASPHTRAGIQVAHADKEELPQE